MEIGGVHLDCLDCLFSSPGLVCLDFLSLLSVMEVGHLDSPSPVTWI